MRLRRIGLIRAVVGGLALALAGAASAWAGPEIPSGNFKAFLAGVKTEAKAAGIHPATLAVLNRLSPSTEVIRLDHRQPELTLTFNRYIRGIVTPGKVAEGRRMMIRNRGILRRIQRRYGVQPRFVVALWGIESDFGKAMGTYPVVRSLATLAWHGRRAVFFRGELIDALRILDRGDTGVRTLRGSWAGAMGQCQFMPSTYLKYAQDVNGDGKRNIWTNRGDALASAANYLSNLGWNDTQTWGREVRLPRRFDRKLIGLGTRKSLAMWSRLGVRRADGRKLPRRAGMTASIVLGQAGKGPAFLVYDNFRAILQWNRSTLFALAVGKLSDDIGRR